MARLGFTLSGPGVDRSYPSASLALSVGINRAGGVGIPAAQRPTDPATYYVRDAAGIGVAIVDRDADGVVTIGRPS